VNENKVDCTSRDERSGHSHAFGAGDSKHTVLCNEFEQGSVCRPACLFPNEMDSSDSSKRAVIHSSLVL
jgi:hypothetical protein